MSFVKVQDCGCIALPEEVVEQARIYPGATLSITAAEDGGSIQIVPVERTAKPTAPAEHASCGR